MLIDADDDMTEAAGNLGERKRRPGAAQDGLRGNQADCLRLLGCISAENFPREKQRIFKTSTLNLCTVRIFQSNLNERETTTHGQSIAGGFLKQNEKNFLRTPPPLRPMNTSLFRPQVLSG